MLDLAFTLKIDNQSKVISKFAMNTQNKKAITSFPNISTEQF